MWKKLYEVLTRLFALTQKVERHDKEIVEAASGDKGIDVRNAEVGI